MKKTILVVLSSMLLSGSLLANADAISQETTETGIVFTQKKVVSSPRNPKDPREPFIGKQGFIDTFEDDNEQNHSLATQANPKLLSCNEETDLCLRPKSSVTTDYVTANNDRSQGCCNTIKYDYLCLRS